MAMPLKSEVKLAIELCDKIEAAIDSRKAIQDLIDEWNLKVSKGHTYELAEFALYNGSQSQEDFVQTALCPKPFIDNYLTFAEAKSVLRYVVECEGTEAEQSYYLSLLEVNYPNGNVSDLIFWPNEWFNNDDLLHTELNSEQMLHCLSVVTDRFLPDQDIAITLPDDVEVALSIVCSQNITDKNR